MFNDAIDLKVILQGLKNDQTIMSKLKKPKQESLKNYFYLINKTKFELFEPAADNDHEIIEKIKKKYAENSDEIFIDEMIFSQIENLSKINFTLHRYLRRLYVQKAIRSAA